MLKIISTLKKSLTVALASILLLSSPVAVTFADDDAPCVPPSQTQPGVHQPNGADASLFTYQCDGDYAGMWTSDHFVYNPATQTRNPKVQPTYTYNNDTGMWDYDWWDFSASLGGYRLVTLSVSTPPEGAQTVGGPPAQDPNNTPENLATNDPAATGPGSGNGVSLNGTNNTTINNTNNATINNGILTLAGSGNASVSGNTLGGSATSGNAQAIANVINMLQSTSNVLGDPNMITFTANINGDVNGDLLLNPAQLGNVQPANVSTSLDNNTTVNNTNNATMNNNINVGAGSGDASVNGNSQAGDATSGTATAVANIVNSLNSYVTAGKSFLGVININGNLNGDILLPPDFVDTLLANNVPHYNVTTNLTNNSSVTSNNNSSIANNVNASANTGDATVADNTGAGSATSGNANTNLTVFNLTGSEVVASNDLLVFVNVLGQWYGMIMNAPAGTTAASLGGGVSTVANITNNADLTNTNNQAINNNINVGAQSGDASVTGNTSAGNAKSGDATASVNIANLINDRLTLNGWFGLLFINVFGTWNGSFGVNTSAGDPVATAAPQSSGNGTALPTFSFVPTTEATAPNSSATNQADATDTSAFLPQASVLAAHAQKAAAELPQLVQGGSSSYLLPILGVSLALILVVIGEKGNLLRRNS